MSQFSGGPGFICFRYRSHISWKLYNVEICWKSVELCMECSNLHTGSYGIAFLTFQKSSYNPHSQSLGGTVAEPLNHQCKSTKATLMALLAHQGWSYRLILSVYFTAYPCWKYTSTQANMEDSRAWREKDTQTISNQCPKTSW